MVSVEDVEGGGNEAKERFREDTATMQVKERHEILWHR